MKIKIENVEYILDVNEALRAGAIKKLPKYPFIPGDVYVQMNGDCNPFLLIEVIYDNNRYKNPSIDEARWQLFGLGCTVNSGEFFEKLHTRLEIEEYLVKNRMVFCKNINKLVDELVNDTSTNT